MPATIAVGTAKATAQSEIVSFSGHHDGIDSDLCATRTRNTGDRSANATVAGHVLEGTLMTPVLALEYTEHTKTADVWSKQPLQ